MSSVQIKLAALSVFGAITVTTPAWAVTSEDVDLPVVTPIELHYSAIGPSGVRFTPNAAMASLASTLQRSSGYAYSVRAVDKWTAKQGAKAWVDYPHRWIVLEYVALHNNAGDETGTKMDILIPVSVEETGQQFTIRLEPPVRATMMTESLWPFPYPHLPPTDRLVADYQRAMSRLADADVRVKADASGEIEAKYAPEAILGNFMRMWGAWYPLADRSYVAGRQYLFHVPINGKDGRVTIAVFPYRDGSKVQYAAPVSVAVRPDQAAGESSEMEQVRRAVQSVVDN